MERNLRQRLPGTGDGFGDIPTKFGGIMPKVISAFCGTSSEEHDISGLGRFICSVEDGVLEVPESGFLADGAVVSHELNITRL